MWVAGLDLLVTGDTAASHIAAAAGTPVVSLHFSTLVGIWRPRAPSQAAVALQSPTGASCRLMRWNGTCERQYLGCFAPCRASLTAADVVLAAEALLARR